MKAKWLIGSMLGILCANPYAQAESEKQDQWSFQIAPYAWLSGQKGTVATFSELPSADIDIDFWDDILGNINGALFLSGRSPQGAFRCALRPCLCRYRGRKRNPGASVCGRYIPD